MKPTRANMKLYYPMFGTSLIILSGGEEYSANPGDYFYLSDDESVPGELVVRSTMTYYHNPEELAKEYNDETL